MFRLKSNTLDIPHLLKVGLDPLPRVQSALALPGHFPIILMSSVSSDVERSPDLAWWRQSSRLEPNHGFILVMTEIPGISINANPQFTARNDANVERHTSQERQLSVIRHSSERRRAIVY